MKSFNGENVNMMTAGLIDAALTLSNKQFRNPVEFAQSQRGQTSTLTQWFMAVICWYFFYSSFTGTRIQYMIGRSPWQPIFVEDNTTGEDWKDT